MKSFSKYILLFSAILVALPIFAQVPLYNSYPSASATIFLDFDGQFVNGTSWNSSGPINCAPANLTADQISEIVNRVAEDYRPFNVNITTDSTKYWSAPLYKRIRIILTTTYSWYGSSAAGVSFIGSFSWGDNTPSFVFTSLLNYNTKNVAEAASHEAGHTLGLRHQSSYDANCVKLSEYNFGNGAGEIGWAPIMGAGYNQNLTLWHNGSNPYGCTDYQDDLGMITGPSNGFGYRSDDYGNDAAHATSITVNNNQFNVNGVIEKDTDKDVFQVILPSSGYIHLTATPYNVGANDNGANLDMQVDLIDNNQQVINTYNPAGLLSAIIDTTLTAGVYYFRVHGSGNIYAPEYASLGSYSLSGTIIPPTPLPLHELQLHGTTSNDQINLSWIIEADEKLVKQVLEVSTDGVSFKPLTQPETVLRQYQYHPDFAGVLTYRLSVNFDNGSQYYSNIISLHTNSTGNTPALITNLIRATAMIKSPGEYNFTIYDLSGRTLLKGRIKEGNNQINCSSLSSGMYIIQYTGSNESNSEKFAIE